MHNQTRMEKWKKYREDITKNISLQSSILESNEKLSILNKRLLEVFPEYKTKFKKEPLKIEDIKVVDIETPSLFDTSDIENMIQSINEVESSENVSLQYIEDFEFSSGQLDELIAQVSIGKAVKSEYVNMEIDFGVNINQVKKVELAKKGKE